MLWLQFLPPVDPVTRIRQGTKEAVEFVTSYKRCCSTHVLDDPITAIGTIDQMVFKL